MSKHYTFFKLKYSKFGVVIKGITATGQEVEKTLLRIVPESTEKEFRSMISNEISQKEYIGILKNVKLVSINCIK